MNQISSIKLFLQVAEEGSFSKVARNLGTTPSAISRKISQLENQLGARLFQRTTRKQSLTEAGEIYRQHTRSIVADIREANLAVTRVTDSPSGTLRVSAEADFAHTFIEPILPEFLALYPDVQIRLSMGEGLVDLVETGIDVAIRMGHLTDSSIVARKIATSRSIICASPKYLAKNGYPKHPDELQTHNCLSFQTKLGKNSWKFKLPGDPTDIPVSGQIGVNSLVFLRGLAIASEGIILVPKWIIKNEIADGRLVQILADFPLDPSSTPIHAVFAHNRHLAPKVRVFVDFLIERMANP